MLAIKCKATMRLDRKTVFLGITASFRLKPFAFVKNSRESNHYLFFIIFLRVFPWINASAERFVRGVAAISGDRSSGSLLDKIAPLSEDGIRNILKSGLIFVRIRPIVIEDLRIFYQAAAATLKSL